ncbi:hypothetical protein J5N97_018875 [Dioscorea zingiberensis]|uniref:Origin recognition complex subunit 3 N-terminal domain-containing protein n=1 Tax=Dioscorea zingiberensis TaxID=325984 RepID=A0A9D5CD31_9LILI|nr:hypothetical protein J5N97_018875 [Dioscorea zingiberensis]
MSFSPASNPPSPPSTSDGVAADDNLQVLLLHFLHFLFHFLTMLLFFSQPFFVLHKASQPSSTPRKTEARSPVSKKTKRRIDLSASPSKTSKNIDDSLPSDPSDPVFDQLRFEAFHRTWSKIDTTIKASYSSFSFSQQYNHPRKLAGFANLSLPSDPPGLSLTPRFHARILCQLMLSADKYLQHLYALVRLRHILFLIFVVDFGLFYQLECVLVENAEFVDDLLTFQELGEHLKFSGCHVANLSSLDFSAKYGIGCCLSSLLRILVPGAADVADIAVLASWYSELSRHDNPVVVIIDDLERSNGAVLAEFILMLSEWAVKVPVIFIMGVATTIDTPRRLLSSAALQCLLPCKFTLGSPCEKMNALIEAVLVKPCTRFTISHKVAVFLRSYFLKHDGTVTSFIRALKLACIKHFTMECLSFLGHGVLDDDCETAWLHKYEVLPDACVYASDLPSHKRFLICTLNHAYKHELGFITLLITEETITREKGFKGNGNAMANGLNELRRLHKHWGSIVMCLFGTGKLNKMQLLDICCEALDPASYTLNVSDDRSLFDTTPGGIFSPAKGGSIAQAIYKGTSYGITHKFA